MNHLKDHGREYRAYIPCQKGDIKNVTSDYNNLRIDVEYALGGPNYFSGGYNPRGYRVCLRPVSLAGNSESYVMLGDRRSSGGYLMIEQATRFNKRRLFQIAEKMDSLIPDIAKAYMDDDTNALRNLCKIETPKEVTISG